MRDILICIISWVGGEVYEVTSFFIGHFNMCDMAVRIGGCAVTVRGLAGRMKICERTIMP